MKAVNQGTAIVRGDRVIEKSILGWIVLILVWVERSLHCAQVCRQSFPWPLKLMLAQAVCRRDVDLLWRLQAAQGQMSWIAERNVPNTEFRIVTDLYIKTRAKFFVKERKCKKVRLSAIFYNEFCLSLINLNRLVSGFKLGIQSIL